MSLELLDYEIPSNESIMEAMISLENSWDDMHHHIPFLPYLEFLERHKKSYL
jgi:hypothetical protein